MNRREALAHLRYHWGQEYTFRLADGIYTATARYGSPQRDTLAADTPEDLLTQIRRHYRPHLVERSST